MFIFQPVILGFKILNTSIDSKIKIWTSKVKMRVENLFKILKIVT